MFAGYGNDPMPSDKLMKLFIIQSISAFVANDYDTGVHFLKEIKQTYAEHMGRLNPTLKNLAKEIIQAVDLFNPGSSAFASATASNAAQAPMAPDSDNQPQLPDMGDQSDQATPQQPATHAANEPKSVASELQELLDRRRAKRRR